MGLVFGGDSKVGAYSLIRVKRSLIGLDCLSDVSESLVLGQVAKALITVYSFRAFFDRGHWKQSFRCSLCCALMETGWPALLAPWPVWRSWQLGQKEGLSPNPSNEKT